MGKQAAAITEEEKASALAEFRKAADVDEKIDDATCFRFLRARQYNVEKAVAMFNAMVAWRAKNDVATVLNTPFPVDKKLWQHSFHGRDKQGRPVFIERTGHLDVKSLIVGKGYTMDTLIRAHIYTQEYVAQLAEEATKHEGRNIEQTLSILDLEGAGVWVHLNSYAREFFTILSGIAQNYYPERLGKLVVINAPRAFPMAWNFVKPLLDPNTVNKIFMPSHANQTKVLLELVDECFIPKKWGGTCDCEAKGCLNGPNPEKFVDALRYDEGTQIANTNSKTEETEEIDNTQELLTDLSLKEGQEEELGKEGENPDGK